MDYWRKSIERKKQRQRYGQGSIIDEVGREQQNKKQNKTKQKYYSQTCFRECVLPQTVRKGGLCPGESLPRPAGPPRWLYCSELETVCGRNRLSWETDWAGAEKRTELETDCGRKTAQYCTASSSRSSTCAGPVNACWSWVSPVHNVDETPSLPLLVHHCPGTLTCTVIYVFTRQGPYTLLFASNVCRNCQLNSFSVRRIGLGDPNINGQKGRQFNITIQNVRNFGVSHFFKATNQQLNCDNWQHCTYPVTVYGISTTWRTLVISLSCFGRVQQVLSLVIVANSFLVWWRWRRVFTWLLSVPAFSCSRQLSALL